MSDKLKGPDHSPKPPQNEGAEMHCGRKLITNRDLLNLGQDTKVVIMPGIKDSWDVAEKEPTIAQIDIRDVMGGRNIFLVYTEKKGWTRMGGRLDTIEGGFKEEFLDSNIGPTIEVYEYKE